MNNFPHIVVGTYEEFVLGYNIQYENEKSIKCKLHQSFATHSHQASVRCVASHGSLMATSGADEYIVIYDMSEMKVSTVINYHNATVTCLEFTPDGSHLVTANQNGDIAIFRCMNWTLVKLWKAAHKHANGVLSVSIHPSGSLLMSAGADNIIRFWNLVKGRQAYATNFSKSCSVGNSLSYGTWTDDGNYYFVCIGNTLEVYKTKTAAVVYKIKSDAKITSSTLVKKNLILIASEDGTLEIHSLKEKKIILKKKIHSSRIRSLKFFKFKVQKGEKEILKNYIVSVDSTGVINVWQFKKKGTKCLLFLRGETNCDCRITCLTLVDSKNIKTENDNDNVPETINLNNSTEVTVCEAEQPKIIGTNPLKRVNKLKENINGNDQNQKNKKAKMESVQNGGKFTKKPKAKKFLKKQKINK